MMRILTVISLALAVTLFTGSESGPSVCIKHGHDEDIADETHHDEQSCMFPDHRITFSPERSSNESLWGIGRLPSDCWRVCLRYLSSPRDIGRFKLISKRHHQIHDVMMKLTIPDLQYITNCNYSNQNRSKCRTTQNVKRAINIERTIPLIPCGSMDLDDNEQLSVSYLWRYHFLTKHDMVRGLDCSSGLSFLSIFLRRDTVSNTDQKQHILLMCICDHDRFDAVRLYRLVGKGGYDQQRYFRFNIKDLDELFERDYIMIVGLEDRPIWTMESKAKRMKRKFLEGCRRFPGDAKATGVRQLDKLRKWRIQHPRRFLAGFLLFMFIMFFPFTFCVVQIAQWLSY